MFSTDFFYSYYYLIAWGVYLFLVNSLLFFKGKKAVKSLPELFGIMLFSIFLWGIYDIINLRLHNWSYINFPQNIVARWLYYTLTLSTVVPAILWTAQLLEPVKNNFTYSKKHKFSWPIFTLGMVMLLLPIIWPRFFFPLVWGALFFIFEPVVQVLGGHSLLCDIRHGQWKRTVALLTSGIICGLFWEINNYWAKAKWIYHIPPNLDFGRVVEMPIVGFLGYFPFALSIHAAYQAFLLIWDRLLLFEKMLLIIFSLGFAGFVFYATDHILLNP